MAGFSRFLAVLRLFDERRARWTVPDMAEALAAPASTVYRTVRDLIKAGFLEQAEEAGYRLGPAFIEYDRLLRLSDPLVRAGQSILREIVSQADVPCVALLARLYNDQVMCVADAASGNAGFRSSYERGRPMPLTQGATSKVILAALQPRQLSRLVGALQANGAMRKELAAIRKAGYCIAASEVDAGLTGIAAPVRPGVARPAASLSIVVRTSDLDAGRQRRLALLAVSASSLIAETI